MRRVFPLVIADVEPSKLGRLWRCQAAVLDDEGWRQCKRAVNPKFGTSIYCLCQTHSQPLRRVKGTVQVVKVRADQTPPSREETASILSPPMQ